ncbi:MAG: glycosyltransferase [Armatimonadetes bacterium]|nr:glycosyltransferase [Armatimonadota bacterium]
MNTNPCISVVMAVYNTAPYLEEAVNSILSQTRGDFEFIIVNDGSADGSGEILDNYSNMDHRIRVVHQENRGLPASLNRGIQLARGKYVARMDGDDISLPERLEKQVSFMGSNPDIGLCGTACRLFGDKSGVSWTMTDPEEIRCRMLFWPCVTHPTVMMRRDLILKHDLYYRTDFKQAEDYELWVRFSQVCKITNLPETLFLYRIRAKQATAAFEDDVARWSGKIQAGALRMLGIEPSDEEMELHLALHKSRFEKSRDFVERVEGWLCKIADANKVTRAFDEDTLAWVLCERWAAVCAGSNLGIWAWRRLKESKLYVPECNNSWPISYSSISYAGRVLSSMLGRSSSGRSFKRAIRSAVTRCAGGRA